MNYKYSYNECFCWNQPIWDRYIFTLLKNVFIVQN